MWEPSDFTHFPRKLETEPSAATTHGAHIPVRRDKSRHSQRYQFKRPAFIAEIYGRG